MIRIGFQWPRNCGPRPRSHTRGMSTSAAMATRTAAVGMAPNSPTASRMKDTGARYEHTYHDAAWAKAQFGDLTPARHHLAVLMG
mgnify:CR=1 FL=1